MRRLRILTWHVHGSYLYYLARAPHEFFLPVKPGRPRGYIGRDGQFGFGGNVHDVPADAVRGLELDLVIYQLPEQYLQDRLELLTEAQQRLPRIYLEHDTPRGHPTDTPHPVDDPATLLVHVTRYNELMWDNGRTPTMVVEHGVEVPAHVRWTGERAQGLVVVNHLRSRGRLAGRDLFDAVRREIPLELVGMDAESLGGYGEVRHADLPAFAAPYRFFFHPIRYTSLGLAVCEAMAIGMPIVGVPTTELPGVIEPNVSGVLETTVQDLVRAMQR